MIILIHLQDRPQHFNQIRKKSSGPEWAIWHPTPEWLPASFHSTAGLTGFLKWAKSKPFMASGETELLPRPHLDQVVLAYGLGLRDILFSSEQEDDAEQQGEVPAHLYNSACEIRHIEEVLACCTEMTKQISAVFGVQSRPKRRIGR
jgi:hypothetical protein